MSDPVFYPLQGPTVTDGLNETGWYFFDESYDIHGPFDTEERACHELTLYGQALNEVLDTPNGAVTITAERYREYQCAEINGDRYRAVLEQISSWNITIAWAS